MRLRALPLAAAGLAALVLGPAAHGLGPVSGKYLMPFLACNRSGGAQCNDPRNHQVYLAESSDGASWALVPGWTPYSGSVPDLVRRGSTLYIYTPGNLARYHLDTNVLDPPTPVTIDGAPGGFVDPSPTQGSNGRIVLFFLPGVMGQDPAGCAPSEQTCTKVIRSATEAAGSDGSRFTLDPGDRASITLNRNGGPLTGSDPDIFSDGSQYVLYVSEGSSTIAYTSSTLQGAYSLVGDLTGGTGGIASGGYVDGRYWTFAHTNRPEGTAIRRAIHSGPSTRLDEGSWQTVLTGAGIGLGASFDVQSPGFAANDPGTACADCAAAMTTTTTTPTAKPKPKPAAIPRCKKGQKSTAKKPCRK